MKSLLTLYFFALVAAVAADEKPLVVQSYGAVLVDGKRIGSVVDVIRQNPTDENLHNRLFSALVARDLANEKRATDAEARATAAEKNAAQTIAQAINKANDLVTAAQRAQSDAQAKTAEDAQTAIKAAQQRATVAETRATAAETKSAELIRAIRTGKKAQIDEAMKTDKQKQRERLQQQLDQTKKNLDALDKSP
jgi:hypothetical protein